MNITTSGTGTSTTFPVIYTGGNGGYVFSGGGAGGGYSVPAPRPQSALKWLDAEIEATCKLARLAG